MSSKPAKGWLSIADVFVRFLDSLSIADMILRFFVAPTIVLFLLASLMMFLTAPDEGNLHDPGLSWIENTPKREQIQACVDKGGQWIEQECYFVSGNHEEKGD